MTEIVEADGEDDVECGYFEGYSTQRFVIITVASTISLFGFLANILLLLVFRRSLPSSIYLAFLSLLDALICAVYLLLFGVDAGFVYTGSETLFLLYHMYIVPVFFISRVVQFAIPYMLIWATVERFVWTCGETTRNFLAPLFSDMGRTWTVVATAAISIALRLPVLFAVTAYYFFDFHIIAILQTVLPFFVLLILNLVIIQRLLTEKRNTMFANLSVNRLSKGGKKIALAPPPEGGSIPADYVLLSLTAQIMKESLITKSSRNKREQLRSAIYTMLVIVMSYLICNGLHLFLTVLERTGSTLLQHPTDENLSSEFYIAFGDTVSIAYMISSAMRILVYMWCNDKLRHQIVDYFRSCTRAKSLS